LQKVSQKLIGGVIVSLFDAELRFDVLFVFVGVHFFLPLWMSAPGEECPIRGD
jgi:hypothetical protein